MKVWVLYNSRSGNTKKIADAIADELEDVLKSEQIPPAYLLDNVQLLFLGTGEYGGKPDDKMIEFIRTMDTKRIKNVVVFSTSGNGNKNGKAINLVKTLLKEKGINVIEDSFACKGKFFFFFNRNRPNNNDLIEVKEFARRIYNRFKNK